MAVLVGAVLAAGCAGQTAAPERARQTTEGAPPSRTLSIAFRYEAADLSLKIPNPIAASAGAKALFNATLTGLDHSSRSQPFLAEKVPELNTASWQVFPDGQMETTYLLRPGLTWHDGQPLTADDFVFAAAVYADPGLGMFSPTPQPLIQEVRAPDPRSVVIRWNSPYADADVLEAEFPALPRHVLGQAFADYRQNPEAREAFNKHPYWSSGYVGLGAYRLERWEPGVALYGEAFPGFVFGRPKIDHIIVRFFGEENTVMVNLLSGDIQYAANTSMRFEHGAVLQREWAASKAGVVENVPSTAVTNLIQFRPEYQKTPALLDLRVRRALAHAVDKQALLDGLFEGQGVIADSSISPEDAYYPEVERVITRYPYDLRRTEALMNEAGFFKDAEGFYASGGARFRPDFMVLAGTSFERHQAIMVETWTRAGIETVPSVLAPAQSRIVENRHTFPGMGQAMASSTREGGPTTREIGTAENRWTGNNRSGWSNAEYDRLWETYLTTLARSERERYLVEMAKLVTEQVPAHILYYDLRPVAYAAALHDPKPLQPFWSVHTWELR